MRARQSRAASNLSHGSPLASKATPSDGGIGEEDVEESFDGQWLSRYA